MLKWLMPSPQHPKSFAQPQPLFYSHPGDEAKLYCMRILKGIDKFQREATTEFKDWAVDDPHEKFIQVFSRWIKENMHPENLENMAEFMKANHTKRYIDVFDL